VTRRAASTIYRGQAVPSRTGSASSPRSDYRSAPAAEHSLPGGRRADPAHMPPSARIAELGQLLATGFRRLRLSLDGSRSNEAQCDQ
jgi:hypothetical protein